MDCSAFKNQIDALLDGTLTPEAIRAAESHRETCADCRAEFAVIERSIALFRTAPTPPPPADLVERTLRTIALANDAPRLAESETLRYEDGEELPRRHVRRSPVFVLIAIAAALLVGLTLWVGYEIGRHDRAGELGTKETAASDVERERGEDRAALIALRADHDQVAAELRIRMRELSSIRAAFVESETKLSTERARSEELGRALASVEEDVRSMGPPADADRADAERTALLDRLASAESELDRVRSEREALDQAHRSLETRLGLLSTRVEELEGELVATREENDRGMAERSALAAANERRARRGSTDAIAAEGRRAAIEVRRQNGRLTLSIRGPKDELVPRLLAFAREDGGGERTVAAVGTLEGLLASELEARSTRKESVAQVPGFFDRLRVGLSDAAQDAMGVAEPAPSWTRAPSSREATLTRLDELEAAWNERAQARSTPDSPSRS
jgi:hypothetical protein